MHRDAATLTLLGILAASLCAAAAAAAGAGESYREGTRALAAAARGRPQGRRRLADGLRPVVAPAGRDPDRQRSEQRRPAAGPRAGRRRRADPRRRTGRPPSARRRAWPSPAMASRSNRASSARMRTSTRISWPWETSSCSCSGAASGWPCGSRTTAARSAPASPACAGTPSNEDWRIPAKFVAYPTPTKLTFDTIVGERETLDSPGYVTFERGGKTYRLQAARAQGGRLVVRLPRRHQRADDPRRRPAAHHRPAARR